MKELNRLYVEINEYNTTYWSKFLLSVWITCGFVIVINIFIALFVKMPLIIKIIYIYGTLISLIIFITIIFTASSVNSKANKSYKLFNRLYIKLNK